MGFVMVPTPGPNSTNTSARPQFTGARIFSIRKREDGITEPTITGFFRNPRANMVRGPGRRDLPIALPSARPAPNADINCSLTFNARTAFKAAVGRRLNPTQVAVRPADVFTRTTSGNRRSEKHT